MRRLIRELEEMNYGLGIYKNAKVPTHVEIITITEVLISIVGVYDFDWLIHVEIEKAEAFIHFLVTIVTTVAHDLMITVMVKNVLHFIKTD